MFALPPLLLLFFFIYVRPQEYYEFLRVIPWLHMLYGFTLLGYMVDVKLSLTRPKMPPHTPWIIAFVLWVIVATAIQAPQTLQGSIVEVGLFVLLGFLAGNAVQSLRALNKIAMMVTALILILASMTIYQSRQAPECIKANQTAGDPTDRTGTPDGRWCERASDCSPLDPGATYYCERVGAMGTNTIYGRARYRGILKDPNDLSLTMAIGLPLLIALMRQWPSRRLIGFTVGTAAVVLWAILPTQSRGGQLVYLTVMGMHFLYRFGLKTSLIAGLPAAPLGLVLIVLKSSRADADASSEERVLCQWNALRMLKENPITGVGYGQITEHFRLTAHNAYLLAPAELGIVGTVIWYGLAYVTFKTLIAARSAVKDKPEARAAKYWAEAMLASQVALHIGIAFLSFCYHAVYWIYIGLVGAVYKAVQSHMPEWDVKFTRRDWGLLGALTSAMLGFWKLFIEFKYRRL
ncbi:MAG: O-antigen ligase family protein [Deltaproteobacteria bacterium]|nr:O-antigen ligase family protein [Deltaproteobacteria bacterium]